MCMKPFAFSDGAYTFERWIKSSLNSSSCSHSHSETALYANLLMKVKPDIYHAIFKRIHPNANKNASTRRGIFNQTLLISLAKLRKEKKMS